MIKKLRDTFVKELNKETGLLVVATDNNKNKPDYPFYSYKFTTMRKNSGEGGNLRETFEPSKDPRFKNDVVNTLEFQPTVIMSFNSYSDDLIECQDAALKAWEWVRHRGRRILSYKNIVVVDVGDIQDRTIYFGDKYEFRQGFDIEFRVLEQIEDRAETIESYKINGKIEGGKQ